MKEHGASGKVQRAGCLALKSLACPCYSDKRPVSEFVKTGIWSKIGAKGGIEAVVAAMKEHRKDWEVQRQEDWGLLANLARGSDPNNHLRIGGKGRIEAVVDGMEEHRKVGDVQQEGCRALANLAQSSGSDPNNRLRIGAEGGIWAVIQRMKAHGAWAEVQQEGCRALLNLAHNSANRLKIRAAGGVEAVVACMKEHDKSAK
eukprot:1129582-Rhodomonas_salina.1